MPIHRIRRATMHEDVHELEHDGERVVSVTPDTDPAYLLVVTAHHGDVIETRLASLTHQARLGAFDVRVGA